MLRVKPVGQYNNNNNNDKRHNPIGRSTIVRVMCAPAGRPIHAMYPPLETFGGTLNGIQDVPYFIIIMVLLRYVCVENGILQTTYYCYVKH